MNQAYRQIKREKGQQKMHLLPCQCGHNVQGSEGCRFGRQLVSERRSYAPDQPGTTTDSVCTKTATKERDYVRMDFIRYGRILEWKDNLGTMKLNNPVCIKYESTYYTLQWIEVECEEPDKVGKIGKLCCAYRGRFYPQDGRFLAKHIGFMSDEPTQPLSVSGTPAAAAEQSQWPPRGIFLIRCDTREGDDLSFPVMGSIVNANVVQNWKGESRTRLHVQLDRTVEIPLERGGCKRWNRFMVDFYVNDARKYPVGTELMFRKLKVKDAKEEIVKYWDDKDVVVQR